MKLVEALSVEAASACADMMADMERYEGGQLSRKDAIAAVNKYDAIVDIIFELEDRLQQQFGKTGMSLQTCAGLSFWLTTVPRIHSAPRLRPGRAGRYAQANGWNCRPSHREGASRTF